MLPETPVTSVDTRRPVLPGGGGMQPGERRHPVNKEGRKRNRDERLDFPELRGPPVSRKERERRGTRENRR